MENKIAQPPSDIGVGVGTGSGFRASAATHHTSGQRILEPAVSALLTDSFCRSTLSLLPRLPRLPRFARLAHPVDTDSDIGTIQHHQNTQYALMLGSFLVQARRNLSRAAGAHLASTPSRRRTRPGLYHSCHDTSSTTHTQFTIATDARCRWCGSPHTRAALPLLTPAADDSSAVALL
jgi:hypothetical protein